jgi:hypothetical protein
LKTIFENQFLKLSFFQVPEKGHLTHVFKFPCKTSFFAVLVKIDCFHWFSSAGNQLFRTVFKAKLVNMAPAALLGFHHLLLPPLPPPWCSPLIAAQSFGFG